MLSRQISRNGVFNPVQMSDQLFGHYILLSKSNEPQKDRIKQEPLDQ